MNIKNEKEISSMKKGGEILALVLIELSKMITPGISTKELDDFAEQFIKTKGGIPAFKGYRGYPATLCTSVNEEVVHGIPLNSKILKDGDLIKIDCGVIYDGLYTDAARAIPVGNLSNEKSKLIKTAKRAFSEAISIIKPGIKVNELGKIIEKTIRNENFNVVKELTGHGVGKKLHEEPMILNYFDPSLGYTIKEGMTLAIEPIFSAGSGKTKTLKDNWTIVTIDNSCAVQYENTILVTKNGFEILTEVYD